MVFAFYNVGARHITIPNAAVAPALLHGGLVTLIAGQWEMASGQTFGATVFCSFGAFFMTYAFFLSEWSGIPAAYAAAPDQYASAIGLWLVAWTIISLILLVASLRSTISLSLSLSFLVLALIMLTAAEFVPVEHKVACTKAGGYFTFGLSFSGFYLAAAALLTPETSYFTLPLGVRAKAA